MNSAVRNINALWMVIYCAIITTAFGLQIFKGETPCPLCYVQRIAMLLICTAALFNLIYGIRTYHYTLALLAALIGAAASTRQILLHICPGFPQFGVPFLGLSLYVWSYLTFICSIFLAALLIGFYRREQRAPLPLNRFQMLAIFWFTLVIIANIGATLYQCGFGPCKG